LIGKQKVLETRKLFDPIYVIDQNSKSSNVTFISLSTERALPMAREGNMAEKANPHL